MNDKTITFTDMARRFQQLHTKPDARAKKGPKGRSISISLSDLNYEQGVLDTLDDYANQWEVSRSEAFFRMVKRYNLADMTNQTLEEAGLTTG